MTPPGPPPRPIEEARRLGIKRQGAQKRPLPSLQETFTLERIPQTPPPDLDVAGQMLWIHVASLPWVSTSDAAALVTMCEVADTVAALRRDIDERGLTYETRGRHYANPSLAQWHEAVKRLSAMQSLFGLTPADRTRQGIAEIKAQSKFDALMAQKGAKR